MNLIESLRSSLAAPAAQAMIQGDLAGAPAATPAAVLVAITDRQEPGVILTVRRDTLRTHPGQIAFPGGQIDPGEDAFSAALREAGEELDLNPEKVTIVGAMDDYRTVTGYVVTPVIAVAAPDLDLTPHAPEVADWFEAPLAYLLDPANHYLESAVFAGRERRYWKIEWNDRRIWGASAAMLVNLSRRLGWT
jgi:8-oxo-dGTP pyrophosphatase MutT (NUDIX family)